MGLLKLDLHRNSQAKDSILAKITDIESPAVEHIIEDLKTREKILYDKINYLLEERTKIKQDSTKINYSTHSLKKYAIAITILAVILTGVSFAYTVDLVGQQYHVANLGEVKSNYVIQNLKGDIIDTWLSWRLVDDYIINVNLIDGQKYPDKADIVRTVVHSEEAIDIDDSLLHKGPKGTVSTYYVGWTGALASASKIPTELYIPHKFNVIESPRGEGDITIKLTSQSSGDGYSGYTKSIADDAQNQILKSEITIYDVDKLSKAQFETILRHEFGHALGLAHSTATEDLMYPTITTDYPYVSDCDIDAIVLLYDGGKSSQVVCEK